MKQITSSPRAAAVVSILLSLPLAVVYTPLALDIEPLKQILTDLLTVDGHQPTALGFILLYGGLFLLPAAFVLNLIPMVRRIGPARRRMLYPLNLIVGVMILYLLSQTWGAFLMEEIACRSGVPNCD